MASAIRRDTVLRLARRTFACPTAPFREGAVIAWVRAFCEARPQLRLRQDADGNLHLRRRGVRADRSPLVFSAHMDHPGFRAIRSTRKGSGWRIEAHFLGGVAPSYFPGARARFFGDDGDEVPARVLRRRPARGRGYPRVSLDARRPVARGAFGMWDLPAFTRAPTDPDLLVGRVADDLAGVTAILAVFDAVDRSDPRRRTDVRALLTRGEEEGFVGALAAMHGRRLPRAARIVALEASKALPHAPQGAGPILRVGDRTSIFDDALTRWIGGVAAGLAGPTGTRFRWQRRLMDGGTCEATVFQRFGHPSAALCVALGNYHNMGARGRIAPETIRLSDLVGLARLLEALLRDDRRAPRPGARDPLRARLDRLLADRRHELRRDPFA